ncbi:hypothetical protein D3C80_1112430 [compost metagenome]
MKKILTFAACFFIISSCKSQTPILPFDDQYGEVRGAYYKDVQNFLNQYEGTWLYSQSGTVLKIVLKKKEMFHENGIAQNFYTDFIVGEYQYIVNGVEIQNTLSNLSINHEEISRYNIYGNIQDRGTKPPTPCPECLPGEMKLLTYYNEPSRRNIEGLSSHMVFRRFSENGVTKLKIWFYAYGWTYGTTTDGQPTDIDRYLLPYGEYVLTKQP